jgi:hypothetical protein
VIALVATPTRVSVVSRPDGYKSNRKRAEDKLPHGDKTTPKEAD